MAVVLSGTGSRVFLSFEIRTVRESLSLDIDAVSKTANKNARPQVNEITHGRVVSVTSHLENITLVL